MQYCAYIYWFQFSTYDFQINNLAYCIPIGLGIIPSSSQISNIPVFNSSGTLSTSIINPISSVAVSAAPRANPNTFQDLPQKLIKRILNLEFIDMSELIPESWKFMEEEISCCHQNRSSHRGLVTDILLWVECYSTLVAVLALQYPTKVPQMMA